MNHSFILTRAQSAELVKKSKNHSDENSESQFNSRSSISTDSFKISENSINNQNIEKKLKSHKGSASIGLKPLLKSKSTDGLAKPLHLDDLSVSKRRRIAATLAGHAISESFKKNSLHKSGNPEKFNRKNSSSLYIQSKNGLNKVSSKANPNIARPKTRHSAQDKLSSKSKTTLKPYASSPIKGSISMQVTNSFKVGNTNAQYDSINSFKFDPSNPTQIKTMMTMDFKSSDTSSLRNGDCTSLNPSVPTLIDVNTSITLYPNRSISLSHSSNPTLSSRSTTLPHKDIQPLDININKPSWDDLDLEDKDDPLMVSDYISDIICYLLANEEKTMPLPNYILKQPEITWSMRELLVEWVIRIHHQMMMLPETLFLAVNLIDRFLSKRFVASSKFQLVGIVGLLIASKYEEMNTHSVKDFLMTADNAYSEEDVFSAERFMLRVLDFDISFSGPLTFLRRTSKADGYNLQNRTVAKYFLEIGLVDHTFLFFKPSLLAASSIYLARKIFGCQKWDANMVHYSNYTENQLFPCVNSLINYLARPDTSSALNSKYSQRCFYYASIISRKWASSHFSSFSKLPISSNSENPFYSSKATKPSSTPKRHQPPDSPILDDASDTTIVANLSTR
ncbi:G2/mitotic-specific cyclin cdc13 [Smittium mucronatum]|uniref:G2/mitotic-specific cyclin cdc13 n=1 Tax=Smittium mucronatum TaxID=133383 RepID=A0A1R0GLN0_9FUNG|nr:G2/mitotic-specific cyclin cdc13 [Smittium mucronatum]